MVVTLIKPEGVLKEDTIMEKIKMDKVRRLLANRYTEEGRVAVMQLLGNLVTELEQEGVGLGTDSPLMEGVENPELAIKSLTDLIGRANKEPKVVEVPGEEVIEA